MVETGVRGVLRFGSDGIVSSPLGRNRFDEEEYEATSDSRHVLLAQEKETRVIRHFAIFQ